MEQKEYIIVGLGIAGICFCEQLQLHNKTFVVIDDAYEGSTAISGGVLNPTILKRFTAVWNASSFYPSAINFYKNLSLKLGTQIFEETPILRLFKSIEEQNNWIVASDKSALQKFLSTEFLKNVNPAVNAPYGYGEVLNTGKIDTQNLLQKYKSFLKLSNRLVTESFQYELIEKKNDRLIYKDISARKIIFSEGASASRNPLFPKHMLIGNKGEYLIINAPDLKLKNILKGSVYIIPLGNNLYKIGATYKRDDYSLNTTKEAKDEMLSQLKSFINCSFEVVEQIAGVRPTTKDYRPLLGSVAENPNMVFFNGLGSRGFLMAPLLSEILYDSLENKKTLPKEMDIQRML